MGVEVLVVQARRGKDKEKREEYDPVPLFIPLKRLRL